MERRTKIIRYVVALAVALASLLGTWLGVPAAAKDEPRAAGPQVFTGWGFDTCVTPSLSSMKAWDSSPYRAVGVYVGGRGRACKEQPDLTPEWVRTVTASDWKVLPIYVGSQAPCVHGEHKKHVPITGDPEAAGSDEGTDAVSSAAALGMKKNSAIYLDMEAYDVADGACADTTLTFVRAWSDEVRRQGYLPGFYSSADSGIRHMESARLSGVKGLPDVMWFARWKVAPSVDDEPSLGSTAWQPHRRIHQYAGNVTEEYGGVEITIDRNMVDAPVAVVDSSDSADRNAVVDSDTSADRNAVFDPGAPAGGSQSTERSAPADGKKPAGATSAPRNAATGAGAPVG
ncbi:glycoside hydrolase domain-containing protein [Streptomyces meridianus]|uniref:DUF1906 domain-containing protein n=1 Tax=Streptomyces meridianus TaxID=2938945 RepID=A0ABT0X7T8_9ACTN|nr:glycoside hydrolase domain-containing protein [Streptomyces meridianus]MCM2578586.1 DUF1906 domain-containing protein [Streptomyces meridianus]